MALPPDPAPKGFALPNGAMVALSLVVYVDAGG